MPDERDGRPPSPPGASGCAPTPDAAYLHLIVNEGPDAGASLEHTHAQLYALGFVPAEVARERERAAAYHERTMGCAPARATSPPRRCAAASASSRSTTTRC